MSAAVSPPEVPPEGRPLPEDPIVSLGLPISRVLRAGAALGTVLLTVGAVLSLASGESILGGARSALTGATLREAFLSPTPSGLLILGVLAVALTPLARVVLSEASFVAARDRPFAAFTLFVLSVLALTVILGVLVAR